VQSGSSSVVREPACKKTTGVSASRSPGILPDPGVGGGLSLSLSPPVALSAFRDFTVAARPASPSPLSTPLTSCTACSYNTLVDPSRKRFPHYWRTCPPPNTLSQSSRRASNFEGRPIRGREGEPWKI